MAYNNSRCGCGCPSPCNSSPCNSCQQKCREITGGDIGVLEYIAGYDENGCKKVALPSTLLGLIDCEGEDVTRDTPIVTCDTFDTTLCEALDALSPAGVATPATQLVGADCNTYTLPAAPTAVTVGDTTSINLEISGANVITGTVNISDDPGNVLELRVDGLFVDIDAADLCPALATLPAGAVLAPGDLVVGSDCSTHAFPPFQAPLTVTDTSTVDHTLAGNNLSSAVRISATPGNSVVALGDGLYAPTGVTNTVSDTTTVDMTLLGNNISSVVRVSADPGNDIDIEADGLNVDICAKLNSMGVVQPAVPGVTLLAGADCNRYTLPSSTNLTVTDSLSVDHTLVGNNLSSTVIISGVPGNLLEQRVDGLAVLSTAPAITINGQDTNCFDMNVVQAPAGNFTISGSPIISPDAGNQLECRANGAYVPAADTTITCAAIQGIFDDTGTRLTPGQNVLVDDCQTYVFPSMLPADTDTIDFSVTNDVANNFVYSAQLRRDPNVCNGLTISPAGVLTPADIDGNNGEASLGTLLVNGPMVTGQVVASPVITLNIVNPSTCRSALVILEMIIPAVNWIADANFASLGLNGNHSFAMGGANPSLVTAMGVFTNWNVVGVINPNQNGTPPGSRTQPPGFAGFIVPPGFVGSYSVQWNVTMETGNGVLVQVGNVGAKYWLHTI